MTTEPRPDDQIDRWLAGLTPSEKSFATTADRMRREGELVRKLLTAQQAVRHEVTGSVSIDLDLHWREMSSRLKQASLLQAPSRRRYAWLAGWPSVLSGAAGARLTRGLAAALAIAMLIVLASVVQVFNKSTPDSDAPVDSTIWLRGDEAAQRLLVPTAELERRAAAVQAALQRGGHRYVMRQSAGQIQFQSKVSVDAPAAAELRALGLHIPDHGRINLLLVAQ